ncbi:MAG: PDZ domain-containing protein [Planctomycetaceae bacterium]|nr:PDZ domain-containing protein [Planctomycetaceae bacterium]
MPDYRLLIRRCCVVIAALLFVSSSVFAQSLRFTPPVISVDRSASALSSQHSLPDNRANSQPVSPSLTPRYRPLPSAANAPDTPDNQHAKPHQQLYPYAESAPSGLSSTQQTQQPLLLSPAPNLPNNHKSTFTNPRPLPIPPNAERIESIIRNGELLESESRWADALTHYEGGLQIYRNNNLILQKFVNARFHYDIRRRSEDASYLKSLKTASFVEALALYEEIISRIQTNYVDVPDWEVLFRNGLRDVSIALADANFRLKSNIAIPPEKIDACIELFQRTADTWAINNRENLKNGILRLAEIGLQQINLNPVIVLMEFTCGITNSLDPYTAFLTPNQLNDTYSMISGNFVGLGVELKSDRESLMIVRVIQGSPAKEAGLSDGDRIHSVDGIPTKGKDTDTAANLLQGQEGTYTELVVQTAGSESRKVRILRRRIEVPSVEDVKMLSRELGYIKLTGFQTRTVEELRRAVLELERSGMKCLALDLRHNPGGLLQMGVEVANMFISDGVIVRTRGRQGAVETPYMATSVDTLQIPLILLIDEASASASEIVAGAIKDHKRGEIIGRRSYGKGTIQAILPVNGNYPNARAGLRLTVEKFLSPHGVAYSGVGVLPDVAVDTEQRVTVAKLVDGKLQIPVNVRVVSSEPNDPFVQEAIKVSQRILKQ